MCAQKRTAAVTACNAKTHQRHFIVGKPRRLAPNIFLDLGKPVCLCGQGVHKGLDAGPVEARRRE